MSGTRPAGPARMSMFRGRGARTRRLGALLRRRRRTKREDRAALDHACFLELFKTRAIVFTDTSDFTTRTARDGILHFLRVFDEAVAEALLTPSAGAALDAPALKRVVPRKIVTFGRSAIRSCA